MAQHTKNRPIEEAVELLKTNGFEGLADAVTVLANSAMVAERSEYLGAAPYERSSARVGYANGYKGKLLKTRLGIGRAKRTKSNGCRPRSANWWWSEIFCPKSSIAKRGSEARND